MKKAKSKSATKKPQPVVEPEIKKHATFELSLTKFELLHLRDLMGILLPPDGAQTVSQSLASAEDRSLIESMLWDKLVKLCKAAKLPMETEAPDYIIAPVAPPPMGVFQVNQDLQSQSKQVAGWLPDSAELQEEDTEQQEEE